MKFTNPFTNEDKKGLSLPGIIDIIFLLLVYALVRLSMFGSESENTGTAESFLPLVRNVAPDIPPHVSTLTFEITREKPEDPRSRKVIYAILPSHDPNRPITWEEGRTRAKQDPSLQAVFPNNFITILSKDSLDQSAPCRLIREQIARYKSEHFRRPHPSNTVQVLALKGTEFRIIRYILDQCSQYGDTIPAVSFHVVTN